jgi:hypothetical protein
MMKKIMPVLLGIFLLANSSAFADSKWGDKCGSACRYKSAAAEHKCPITAKFMKKAAFFLDNRDEIGLSADQVKQIKGLELIGKKAAIKQMADMQMWMLDLEAKLSEEKVDVEGVGAMIDEGSAAMALSTKSMVANYAKLKEILTADQMAKAKEIWMKKG